MTDIKKPAVDKLAKLGAHMPVTSTLDKLAEVIEMATGLKRPHYVSAGDFVEAFACPPKAKPSQINLMTRKPYSLKHPRLADIIAGQPPMQTMRGIGNNKQPGGFIPVVWG